MRSLNTTFLVLIPQKGNVEDLKEYRTISLLGSLYKILAKVLANRLRCVIDKVVSPSQNTFVEGRQIFDATLISNEVVDSMLRRNDGGLFYKLDIEKAYDHLSWEFMLEVMRRMSFGQIWPTWISWCMSTTSFSILSPYLFVLGNVFKGESVMRGVFIFVRQGVSLEALKRKLFVIIYII